MTDSRAPGEAKDTEGSALFQIYQAFATEAETAAMRKAYADGVAWGDAKAMLLNRIDQDIAPMREHYESLISNPASIEAILQAGGEKARALSAPFIRELRHAVGLRKLAAAAVPAKQKTAKASAAGFKQYRERDGQFYFKLLGSDGRLLLQSLGFALPRDAAQAIALLQQKGEAALPDLSGKLAALDGVGADEIATALNQLQQASS